LGLLLQRVVTSAILLYFAAIHLLQDTNLTPSLPHLAAAVAGVLLLFGLWTPIAGLAISIIEFCTFLIAGANSLLPILLASLGITVAMIGPGAWSIDAQLYGRKHIEPSASLSGL
jgi:uncharacterized membrane protein YphA (DoxX/SURF4 family)